MRHLLFNGKLKKLFADPDVAIDLGTANTRLFAHGEGLVCDEPSVIKQDWPRGPGLAGHFVTGCESCVFPLREGVVTNVVAAALLLRPLLLRARKFGLRKPRVLACAPSDASESDVEALVAAIRLTGISDVKVVPEPLAAAVGSGLDVSSQYAQALIDIGDGVTDIAIIRSGVLIKKAAIRLACGNLHLAVRRTVANRYGVVIPLREAERLTREIGAVCRNAKLHVTSTAVGLDRLTGRETAVAVNREDVCNAIRPVIRMIMETVRDMFRCFPPDIAAEVIESGICLTGGGACLQGMKESIAEETSLEVRVAADPLHGVISGAGQMLSVGVSTGFWRF